RLPQFFGSVPRGHGRNAELLAGPTSADVFHWRDQSDFSPLPFSHDPLSALSPFYFRHPSVGSPAGEARASSASSLQRPRSFQQEFRQLPGGLGLGFRNPADAQPAADETEIRNAAPRAKTSHRLGCAPVTVSQCRAAAACLAATSSFESGG